MSFLSANDAAALEAVANIANVVVASLALVIAYVSIRVSHRMLLSQEAHNRLSVRPLPMVVFSNFDDVIRVKIANKGVGPMIVQELRIRGLGKRYGDVISFMPPLPPGLHWSHFTAVFEGRTLMPGEDVHLLEFKSRRGEPVYEDFAERCREALADLTFGFCYTDIYGQTFPTYSRSGDWFRLHPTEKRFAHNASVTTLRARQAAAQRSELR